MCVSTSVEDENSWIPAGEQAGLEEPREATRAGSGGCIMVHYLSCTVDNPKTQHIHLSCSKNAQVPLLERAVEPPWVVKSSLKPFSL